ncbi:MAG: ATP-binding cassette domain-containing protein [Candidatus Manganitrophus sp.]|nr:MAG: ATP-binding cassette domain-containing protein [Candidatus Manganitrophus sp.]
MPSPILCAKGLSFGPTRNMPLVRNLSFDLYPSQLLWVSGPNGAGKSTLIRVILNQGWIESGILEKQIEGKNIGYLPQLQNRQFHLPVTLQDIVVMAVGKPLSSDQIIQLGLLRPEQLHLGWNTASGGERKRALLTRLLLQNPTLLILDEPFGHLDAESYTLVVQVIERFLTTPSGQQREKSALIVEHGAIPETLGRFDVVKMEIGYGTAVVSR